MDYNVMSWQQLVDECYARGCTINYHHDYNSREELIEWLREEFCYID